MKYGRKLLFKSTSIVISEPIPKMGCAGGMIGKDAEGNIAMPFNSERMYRGFVKPSKEADSLIYA
ncbi:MAG: beta-aspartyl-peptidase (threonine type) [Cryomorphaceae bacterium]|jgi:beta-aspartyl-peptidase (threonine type)